MSGLLKEAENIYYKKQWTINMIKISNGTKKGFRLKVPNNDLVRPKTSKTRKMIFDILQSVEGMEILDIFAGSGSLGIEALSMGATLQLLWIEQLQLIA